MYMHSSSHRPIVCFLTAGYRSNMTQSEEQRNLCVFSNNEESQLKFTDLLMYDFINTEYKL